MGDFRCPWFLPITFWLPFTWTYEVVIKDGRLTFGYGPMPAPWTKITVQIESVSEVQIGSSSWKDNLFDFGGWGIRYGLGLWCYNAANGPWVQFTCIESKAKYRLSTQNAEKVSFLLTKVKVDG